MSRRRYVTFILAVLPLVYSGCSSQKPPVPASPSPSATQTAPVSTPTASAVEMPAPYSLVSQERMFAYLENLIAIQPYSGWRNSATEGESEGLDYVARTMSGFGHLQDLGLELERQSFHVFLATEIWESRLFLTREGQEAEVPANGVSGHRLAVRQAIRFDSDGVFNDAERNPVEVAGGALVLRTADDVRNLAYEDAEGRIAFLDFAAIDPVLARQGVASELVTALIERQVAGLVLVVSEGRGEPAPDGTFLEDLAQNERLPILNARLEDLTPAGIDSWEALAQVESARLIWDTDVFSPGDSGNLVARIPGADSSGAVILGAHIDSANTPGAGDNALNCAVLLEVARVLDEGAVRPPADVYLVWFGSEELGLYGSQHFVNTHQELLDRTLAAFLMDGFTAYEPGPTILAIQEASHASFGNTALPFADYLSEKADAYGVPMDMVIDSDHISSDDGPFYGFVPQVRFAFGSLDIGERFHSPYDTVESVQDQGAVMEQSAWMALIAALETPLDAPDLRVTPEPERRALIVATHTEVIHMTPTMLIHLDRALAWEGFDVDVVPYGQSVTAEDVAEADLVIALPVIDYPSVDSDPTVYDEQWRPQEVELLLSYVEQGGFLILTNSANHVFRGRLVDANEDWEDANALAAPFGIHYGAEPFRTIRARVAGSHPITGDLFDLVMLPHNGLPLSLEGGVILAEAQNEVAVGLVEYGGAGGQVLALSDLGSLDLYNPREGERDNLDFLVNLARYARDG
jgi:ribosomal protein S18 acetylase RimI-like enzyme